MSTIPYTDQVNSREQELLTFLEKNLVAPQNMNLKFLLWYMVDNMFKDWLQNRAVDLLVSVRFFQSDTTRTYNMRPLTDIQIVEIGVWGQEAPDYRQPYKNQARNNLVSQIKQLLKSNAVAMGTEKSCKNNDHAVGQTWRINTNILVSQLNEKQ